MQRRDWVSWQRWTVLAMLAYAYLAVPAGGRRPRFARSSAAHSSSAGSGGVRVSAVVRGDAFILPGACVDLQSLQAENRVSEGAERGYQLTYAWELAASGHLRRASAARTMSTFTTGTSERSPVQPGPMVSSRESNAPISCR